jgi:hypothetical protein
MSRKLIFIRLIFFLYVHNIWNITINIYRLVNKYMP